MLTSLVLLALTHQDRFLSREFLTYQVNVLRIMAPNSVGVPAGVADIEFSPDSSKLLISGADVVLDHGFFRGLDSKQTSYPPCDWILDIKTWKLTKWPVTSIKSSLGTTSLATWMADSKHVIIFTEDRFGEVTSSEGMIEVLNTSTGNRTNLTKLWPGCNAFPHPSEARLIVDHKNAEGVKTIREWSPTGVGAKIPIPDCTAVEYTLDGRGVLLFETISSPGGVKRRRGWVSTSGGPIRWFTGQETLPMSEGVVTRHPEVGPIDREDLDKGLESVYPGEVVFLAVQDAKKKVSEDQTGVLSFIPLAHCGDAKVSPDLKWVATIGVNGVQLRAIISNSIAEFELERTRKQQEEAGKETVSDAKQVALVLILYADSNDDRLPTLEDLHKALPFAQNPDSFAKFVYTYRGPYDLSKIEDPSKVELGYILGPGGRAIVYADSHVKWVPDR